MGHEGNPPTLFVDPKEITLTFGPFEPPDLLFGLFAIDDDNINITFKIEVDRIISQAKGGVTDRVDPRFIDVYVVDYVVFDQFGSGATDKRVYRVKDLTAPVITFDMLEIEIDVFDPSPNVLEGVLAIDDLEGNISHLVVPSVSVIDTMNLDTIEVLYNVSDANGNEAVTKSRLYHVVDRLPPAFSVENAVVDLTVGSAINPGVFENLESIDNVDGAITHEITTSDDFPQSDQAGIYPINYQSIDSSGNSSQGTRTYFIRNVPTVDTDLDSLDDEWEISQLSDLRWLGNEDSDGDTLTNQEEYELNMDPRSYLIPLRPGWSNFAFTHVPNESDPSALLAQRIGSESFNKNLWCWDAKIQRFVISDQFNLFQEHWVYILGDEEKSLLIELPSFDAIPVGNEPPRIANSMDRDGDGLLDSWEMDHFGETRWIGVDDNDFDSLLNFEEQQLGTDPLGIDIPVRSGWNNVSIPKVPLENQVESIFVDGSGMPVYIGRVWFWDPAVNKIRIASSVKPFYGYWFFARANTTIHLSLR